MFVKNIFRNYSLNFYLDKKIFPLVIVIFVKNFNEVTQDPQNLISTTLCPSEFTKRSITIRFYDKEERIYTKKACAMEKNKINYV